MAEGMISFEQEGFPVELSTDRDIAKAIAAARLRPETMVTVRTPGEPVQTRRADSVERLKPHFGLEEAPAAPLPETVTTAEPSPPPESPWNPTPAPPPAPRYVEEPAPVYEEEATLAGPAPAAPADNNKTGMIVLGAIGLFVLVAAIVGLAASSDSPPPFDVASNGAYGGDVGNAAGTDMNAVEPLEESVGEPQTYYAVAGTPVHSEPSGSAVELAAMSRGESIFGVRVRRDGLREPWIRIEVGRNIGGYVRLAALSGDQRPPIAVRYDQNWTLAAPTGLLAGPAESARRLQSLDAGTEVQVVGQLENGWFEIARRIGGVGYLSPSAFDEPADEGAYGNAMDPGVFNTAEPAPPPAAPRAEPAPVETRIFCLLEHGEEIRTSREECRARAGKVR